MEFFSTSGGKIVLIVTIVVGLLITVAYTVLAERWIAAAIQRRIGPNRVGWHGVLQPFADLLKLLFKENIKPKEANKFYHTIAPMISLVAAFSSIAVIPFSSSILIADVPVGVLFVLAVTSVGVYGITLSGWASGSTYSSLGGLRSSAQMVSYEIAMGLAVVSVVVISGSMSMHDIVKHQTTNPLHWNIVQNFFGFVIFLISAFAETNRAPFDLPEAEQELVGGYHTEYSAMKFALFMLSEYTAVIISSAVMVTLFLGGYQIPFLDETLITHIWVLNALQFFMFFLKTVLLIFLFIWVRWSVPRFKYKQLMDLGWRKLIPIGLVNLLMVSVLSKW